MSGCRLAALIFMVLFSFLVLIPFDSAAQTPPTGQVQTPFWSSKPDVTAFERTENERLAAVQKSVDQITSVKGPRTVENTLVPFDEAQRQIGAAGSLAGLMQQVHPDAAFRDSATAMTTKVSSVSTGLSLNRAIYDALKGIDLSNADEITRYYVQRQLLEYHLAGVDKDEATRTKLKQLQEKLIDLQSNFDRNISDDVRTITVDSASELDGVPQDYIAGHKPGADGKISITTSYPDVFPVLTFAKNDEVRKKVLVTFNNRAYPKNQEVLLEMVRTRAEIASLIGYASWADYNAADTMIRSGVKIGEFIQDLDTSARPMAAREFALILAEKQKTHPGATEVQDYEGAFLREAVRRSNFDFDSSTVRPYFPYPRVKQGVLDVAAKLFQLKFQQEPNVPAWDPSVETWDVYDSGKMIGRFYLDMHPRAGKYSHAEMSPVLVGIRDKQLPEAVLVCNFAEPTAADPGLMDYNDVVIFLHEFGHLMHWILAGKQQWAGVSGLSMEGDFIEAPSEMLEEWMRSPQVLATFARHYKTNEPIPTDLVMKMNRASAFGRASWVMTQLGYTSASYQIYDQNPDGVNLDHIAEEIHKKYSPLKFTPGQHEYASFGHLAGYSSAYYTYLWDKVIAIDFMTQFNRGDLFAQAPAARYRRTVLEPGGSTSANALVKNFLGRPQNMDAFREWMGEEFVTTVANH
jgi:thimet oligopeptidase